MKIGLALSGGGAMGVAHLGVIDVIKKNNIKIDEICGTSAGAIAGLLFASGREDAFDQFLSDFEALGFTKKTNLLFNRNETIFAKIEEKLRENIKIKSFSDLKIKFSCVATDITNGEMIILNHGDPIKAVMASAAYPGVFPIQKFYGKLLVDGGLTSNFPVHVLRNNGLDFIIGSSLYTLNKIDHLHLSDKPKLNPIEVAIRSIDIMSNVLAGQEAKECDFCFYPPIDNFAWHDFNRFNEIREVGQEYANKNANDLLRRIKSSNKKGFWQTVFGQ